MWAILSRIEGNLTAYNAVLEDIKEQKFLVEDLYILGDIIAANPDSEELVQRIRFPASGELIPNICLGWWEEQCLILYGLGAVAEPIELLARYNATIAKQLWDAVSRETVQWMRELDFGFVEQDCLLIHGSSVSVSDEIVPTASPWQILELDRLQRMNVNQLFCGRSGQIFEYQLQEPSLVTSVITLEKQQPAQISSASLKRVIGVGNVGTQEGKATYTLYNPKTNNVKFRTVHY